MPMPSDPWLFAPSRSEMLREILTKPAQRTVGILGLGETGRALIELFLKLGAKVEAADERASVRVSAHPFLKQHPVPLLADTFARCSLVVVSPGIAASHPLLVALQKRSIPVIGELELIAFLAPHRPTAAITGTNGKSTTTALVGHWLKELGVSAFCGGNLGPPLSTSLATPSAWSCAVLEVSSYQMDGAHHFRPQVAAVLNVTPDHLARYGSFAGYQRSKERLVESVPEDGYVILNADDPHTRAMARSTAATVLFFGEQARDAGACGIAIQGDTGEVFGDAPCLRDAPRKLDLGHRRLLGAHNRLNAAAAFLILASLRPNQAASSKLLLGYRSFSGLAHRLFLSGLAHGLTFINDSKATNDAAAAIGIRAVQQPKVVLLGGEDKGGGYHAVAQALSTSPTRAVVCFGAACDTIFAALAALAPHIPLYRAANLPGALEQAVGCAQAKDVVLLSPACASFDAYPNYIARGDAFDAWVQAYALGPKATRPL